MAQGSPKGRERSGPWTGIKERTQSGGDYRSRGEAGMHRRQTAVAVAWVKNLLAMFLR